MKPPLEVRFTESPGLQAEAGTSGRKHSGPTLRGYAAVFNVRSHDLGGFQEKILPGAFADSLRRKGVRALYHHDSAAILGRTQNGTLQLHEDRHGLAFSLVLASTQLGQDIYSLVERGDVSQMSFGFIVPAGGDAWSREGGLSVRTLKTVDLLEISLVGEPAYPQTSVALRRVLDSAIAAMLADRRRRLEALGCSG
jgi:HK97 family phage prohead protease